MTHEQPDTHEQETPKVTYFYLSAAEGTIEAGPDQQGRLDEFTERVGSGEFHVETTGKVPFGCIDGRDTRDGLTPKPDSAGGTESLFVADDLTTKRFAGGGTTREAYANTLRYVSDAGYEVGGHTDSHAAGDGSGCGANDKLQPIYEFIAREGELLRELAGSLGITASDEAYEQIVANAAARTEFSAGRELLEELAEYGDGAVDYLVGDHREVVAVVNTKSGTTLDRVALRQEFGEDYEAFNVDAWTFRESAELISSTPEEVEAKVLALAFYNLATAHKLCGKSMRVVVL